MLAALLVRPRLSFEQDSDTLQRLCEGLAAALAASGCAWSDVPPRAVSEVLCDAPSTRRADPDPAAALLQALAAWAAQLATPCAFLHEALTPAELSARLLQPTPALLLASRVAAAVASHVYSLGDGSKCQLLLVAALLGPLLAHSATFMDARLAAASLASLISSAPTTFRGSRPARSAPEEVATASVCMEWHVDVDLRAAADVLAYSVQAVGANSPRATRQRQSAAEVDPGAQQKPPSLSLRLLIAHPQPCSHRSC